VNTFKIPPNEWETLTNKGITIHAILNGKDVSQWLAIMKDGRKNVLVLVTEDEVDGVDPLEERRHPKSDRV
jgi:hypothetical protein